LKLTVLVDNNTIIDRYYLGEPALSYFIEIDGKKILFDTGYSDVFIRNAYKMNIDLTNLDYLVLSHAHLDHTWGLEPLVKMYTEEQLEGRMPNRAKLIGHPMIFASKTFTGSEEFGINVDKAKLARYFDFHLSQNPLWLTDKVVFLGEIPRENNFEKNSIGEVLTEDGYVEDYNIDDSAICVKLEEGIVIVTGCSHSGICNIIEYAKKVCNNDNILDVVGGFHLQDAEEVMLNRTINYFASQEINEVHPCHCTDLKAKMALSEVVNVKEVGVGLQITY
jgi:7,8-dihydropterin-6-yl-methyl-4-(beta-D-ribofuranosyl)aminobenzene 5'-phosphate synthase